MRVILKNAHFYNYKDFIDTDICIEDGIIKEFGHFDNEENMIDLKGALVCHNFIDIHTHLREPGFEYKETISTGTLAALYGGYGTVVAMANTNPCMDDPETIESFIKKVEIDANVNTYTYSAITENLAGQHLTPMDQNITYPIVKGFSDDGKGVQSDDVMKEAFQKVHDINSIIVAHCEDESELIEGGCIHDGIYAKEHNLPGINNASEFNEVKRDLEYALEYDTSFHICHMSTKESVELLKQAREKGGRCSGEVTPHHLLLTDENIEDQHPNYKMNPPVRSKEDREALINALNTGVITCISTDHAPHSTEEKQKDIIHAPFGIIGLQHAFPLLYTYLVKENIVSLETIINALTIGPGQILDLDYKVNVGSQANLCVFDLNKEYTIKEEDMKSKACNTPFLGWNVYGEIKMNIINGEIKIYE